MGGRLTALAVFNWGAARGHPLATEIDLSRREDLLHSPMNAPGLFYEPSEGASPERYVDVLSRRPVVEIAGRSFDAAARLTRGSLERQTP